MGIFFHRLTSQVQVSACLGSCHRLFHHKRICRRISSGPVRIRPRSLCRSRHRTALLYQCRHLNLRAECHRIRFHIPQRFLPILRSRRLLDRDRRAHLTRSCSQRGSLSSRRESGRRPRSRLRLCLPRRPCRYFSKGATIGTRDQHYTGWQSS